MSGQSSNTVQHFTSAVLKMCSTSSDCSMMAGCRMWEGRMTCSTCCSQSYCNEGVPWGENDVILPTSGVGVVKPGLLVVVMVVMVLVAIVRFERGRWS